MDDVFIERPCRSPKHGDIHLKGYPDVTCDGTDGQELQPDLQPDS